MSNIKVRDVTDLVNFNNPDDECLPITKCVCGQEFPSWAFIISIYPDTPYRCSNCERKLYFSSSVKVFEVLDD